MKTPHSELVHEPRPLQLKHLHLENFRCFETVDLPFVDQQGQPRAQTLVLGNNGHGKTTILRALAIGLSPAKDANALTTKLAGQMIRQNKQGISQSSAQIVIELCDPDDPDTLYRIKTEIQRDSGQEQVEKTTEPKEFPWSRVFVCGYGVNRGTGRYVPIDSYSHTTALQSLFSEEPSLTDPEAILKNFKLAASEKKGRSLLNQVQRVFQRIMDEPNLRLNIHSRGVVVHGPWGGQPFHALGDGYRGTATWVLDFLGRAHQNNIRIGKKGPVGGILLVDEVDEHLHPTWQRHFLSSLSKKLTDVQLVGTTHSPMTIVNCTESEVALCKLRNAKAELAYPLHQALRARTTDQILKGRWFGLNETMDDETEKLLAKYRLAVVNGDPEKVEAARAKVRNYLGFSPLTVLDELAMKIADTYRDEYNSAPAQRKRVLIANGLEDLKRQLRDEE